MFPKEKSAPPNHPQHVSYLLETAVASLPRGKEMDEETLILLR